MFRQILDHIVSAAGTTGVALIVCMLLMLLIQFVYYACIYGRIPKFRNRPGAAKREVEGISVVVVVHQNYGFLDETLPAIMGQDYENFELVVVDVGSDEDFLDALEAKKGVYPNLVTTGFGKDGRFDIGNKMALNVGIKAARYPFVVLTTADACPVSERWLSLMAKGFAKGDVVIGYCRIGRRPGMANRLMRATRLMSGVSYLSSAIIGRPYRGMLQNIGLSRRLYFESRGFNHLNMNVGEDDLYISSIATRRNTSVIIHPNAVTEQYPDGGMSWWRKQRRFYGSTFRFYRPGDKFFIAAEPVSRMLFLLSAAGALVVFPDDIRICIGALWLLRLLAVEHYMSRICRRLGERGLLWAYPLHDLWAPFDRLWLAMLNIFRPVRGIWR